MAVYTFFQLSPFPFLLSLMVLQEEALKLYFSLFV